jgi:DNA adenine methylase
MKYMGSKRRIVDDLLTIILADRKPGQLYVEPFVGGGNMISRVSGPRIGADIDEYAIEALKLIRDRLDEVPKSSTEKEYRVMRSSEDADKGMKGYYGYALSYGGKWFGGWCRGEGRDYVGEAYLNAVDQSPTLQGVRLVHSSYVDLVIPDDSIVYCDPPYSGSTGYGASFDRDLFWEWCREISKNNQVYISEYTAPDDFNLLWARELPSSLERDTGSKLGVECLFSRVDLPLFRMLKETNNDN